MKHTSLALCCLIVPTLAQGQDNLSFGIISCDATVQAPNYVSLEPDMVSTKIVATWNGVGARTLHKYLNGVEIDSLVLSESGDTIWVNFPNIPLIPWSPAIGMDLYNDSVMTAPSISILAPIVWRNGIDTLVMEVDESATNDTMLTVSTHLDHFEEPYAGPERGCSEHHLLLAYTVRNEEGDTLDVHITDLSAIDTLDFDFTYDYDGPPTSVCVTGQVYHSDIGAGQTNFTSWIINVPYETDSICRMMGGTIVMSEAEAFGASSKFSVYPNPCEGEIVLNLPPNEPFSIFTADGRVILSGKTQSSSHWIDTGFWPSGMYHVRASEMKSTFVRQ